MKKVILCGWDVGFRKIGLTKLLRQSTGLSLSEAKSITDAVLRDQSVTISVPAEEFESVASELRGLGVRFTEKR